MELNQSAYINNTAAVLLTLHHDIIDVTLANPNGMTSQHLNLTFKFVFQCNAYTNIPNLIFIILP